MIQPLRQVVRIATENDRRTDEYNRKREKEAFGICEQKILAHGLEMKLVSVECSFEGGKIIFFFTAEGRVDFREPIWRMAASSPAAQRFARFRSSSTLKRGYLRISLKYWLTPSSPIKACVFNFS